jgi:moderate conductance mechanosensitive channel
LLSSFTMWHRLFDTPPDWRLVALAIAVTAAVAWLAARGVRRAVHRLMHLMVRDTVVASSAIVRTPLRLIGFAAFVLVFSVLIVPAFELAGLKPRAGVHLRTISSWTFDSGLRVVLILAVAYAIIHVMSIVVTRFEHEVNFGTGLDALERAKRARTLGAVLTSVTTVIIVGTAVLMVLREFRVDIAPALTGAGIVGVALGFGAQALVRDVIGGFFLILENQVRVGDIASINGIVGLVEAINLRTIVLRNDEGAVYVIPNGTVSTLANLSKDYAYSVISVPLVYRDDPDEAIALVRQVAAEVQADDRFGVSILEPLDVMGVDAFEEKNMRIKLRVKTAPLKQWEVGRELRRRIARAFQAHGLAMWP